MSFVVPAYKKELAISKAPWTTEFLESTFFYTKFKKKKGKKGLLSSIQVSKDRINYSSSGIINTIPKIIIQLKFLSSLVWAPFNMFDGILGAFLKMSLAVLLLNYQWNSSFHSHWYRKLFDKLRLFFPFLKYE